MKTNSDYNKKWLKVHGHAFGRVFKIVNDITGDMYIGHTTAPIKKRLYQAITSANKGITGELYDSIREWGKEAFSVHVLYECMSDERVELETQRLIKELHPTLNNVNKSEYAFY